MFERAELGQPDLWGVLGFQGSFKVSARASAEYRI